MDQFDHEAPEWGTSLSRRGMIQAGLVTAITAGSFGEVGATLAEGDGYSFQPQLAWERSVESELDTRVAIYEDPGVAVALTDSTESGSGTIHAFDVESGERLWTREFTGQPGLQYYEGTLYEYDIESLVAVDPRNGTENWILFEGDGTYDWPAHFEGRYAAFSGDPFAATIVDLSNGTVAWQPERLSLVDAVSLVDGQAVLYGDRELVAFDTDSGERLWKFAEFPAGEFDLTVSASWPYCYVTNVDPPASIGIDLLEGAELWRRDREFYPWYFDVEAEGGITLSMHNGTLERLGPETGEVIWSQSLSDDWIYVYLLEEGLAVPVGRNRIWAVDVATGEVAWNREVDSRFPMVREEAGQFYAAGQVLSALNRDGEGSWSRDLPGEDPLFPDVGDDFMVAASETSVYGFTLDSEGETATTTSRSTEREREEETARTETTITDTGAPGFGVLAALVGIFGAGAKLLRRRDDDGE